MLYLCPIIFLDLGLLLRMHVLLPMHVLLNQTTKACCLFLVVLQEIYLYSGDKLMKKLGRLSPGSRWFVRSVVGCKLAYNSVVEDAKLGLGSVQCKNQTLDWFLYVYLSIIKVLAVVNEIISLTLPEPRPAVSSTISSLGNVLGGNLSPSISITSIRGVFGPGTGGGVCCNRTRSHQATRAPYREADVPAPPHSAVQVFVFHPFLCKTFFLACSSS